MDKLHWSRKVKVSGMVLLGVLLGAAMAAEASIAPATLSDCVADDPGLSIDSLQNRELFGGPVTDAPDIICTVTNNGDQPIFRVETMARINADGQPWVDVTSVFYTESDVELPPGESWRMVGRSYDAKIVGMVPRATPSITIEQLGGVSVSTVIE